MSGVYTNPTYSKDQGQALSNAVDRGHIDLNIKYS